MRDAFRRGDAVIELFELLALAGGSGRRRLVPIEASGVPAFGQYIYEHASGVLETHAIVLLSLQANASPI